MPQTNPNPEIDLASFKDQTIEEYINQTLQLKILKIKKFSLQESFQFQSKSYKKIKNFFTARSQENENEFKFLNNSKWKPKLSYRKLMNEPRILLSVERRKIKTSESIRRANAIFSAPKTRLGFRGQKIRGQSLSTEKQEAAAKINEITNSTAERKQKQIPNLHFNLKYVIEQRKKSKEHMSIEQATKQGSNRGYFAFFGSQHFSKYLSESTQPIRSRLNKKKNLRAQNLPKKFVQSKKT